MSRTWFVEYEVEECNEDCKLGPYWLDEAAEKLSELKGYRHVSNLRLTEGS